jgi:hypothetical protein
MVMTRTRSKIAIRINRQVLKNLLARRHITRLAGYRQSQSNLDTEAKRVV